MRIYKILKDLHFPLWIIKDGAWFFGFPYISLFTAIPTIFLSFYVALKESGSSRFEWLMISFWLLSNTFWMASENFGDHYHKQAEISWVASFSILPFYFFFIIKNARKNINI